LSIKTHDGNVPLTAQHAQSLGPKWFITYKGTLSAEGTVEVESATLNANTTTDSEEKLRAKEQPILSEPDYASGKSGRAKVGVVHKASVVADRGLSSHVEMIGSSLIPRFQQQLPDSDPAKIHFRFYVIDSRSIRVLPYADGTVLVPERLLKRLDNEAQLAAVLSSAIASIVEEQDVRAHSNRTKYRLVEVATLGTVVNPVADIGGIAASEETGIGRALYERSSLEQAARVGLEYMLSAGYDIRQAPSALKISYHHRGGRPVANAIEKQITRQYASVDFSKLRAGEEEYKQWRPK
jgi:predicted Zn-dependent protease